jgi:hypothetical protein
MGDACLEIWPGGWYVAWFDDAADREARWYGTHAECLERAKQPPPSGGRYRRFAVLPCYRQTNVRSLVRGLSPRS